MVSDTWYVCNFQIDRFDLSMTIENEMKAYLTIGFSKSKFNSLHSRYIKMEMYIQNLSVKLLYGTLANTEEFFSLWLSIFLAHWLAIKLSGCNFPRRQGKPNSIGGGGMTLPWYWGKSKFLSPLFLPRQTWIFLRIEEIDLIILEEFDYQT